MSYVSLIVVTVKDVTIKPSELKLATVSENLIPTFLYSHLTFNVNVKGMDIHNRDADRGVVGAALSMDPTLPVYDTESSAYDAQLLFGGYYQQGVKDALYGDPVWNKTVNQQTTANPVSTLMATNDRANAGVFLGNIEGEYKIHGCEE